MPAAQQVVASTSVPAPTVDTGGSEPGGSTSATTYDSSGAQELTTDSYVPEPSATSDGPAWSQEWLERYRAARVPAYIIDELVATGANGATNAELQAHLDSITSQIAAELAQFEAEHPVPYEKLSSKSDAKMLEVTGRSFVEFAMGVNRGEYTDDQIEYISWSSESMRDSMMKDMLPSFIIPGYGITRYLAAYTPGVSTLLNSKGRDPVSKERLYLDFWNHGVQGWMNAALAAGALFTVGQSIRHASHVSRGMRIVNQQTLTNPTGLVATIAAREGVTNLSGMARLKAYMPVMSKSGQQLAGLGRFNDETMAAIKSLPVDSEPAKAIQRLFTKAYTGDVKIVAKSGVSFQGQIAPNARGPLPIVGNRHWSMFEWSTSGSKLGKVTGRVTGGAGSSGSVPVLKLDQGLVGPEGVPLLAASSVRLMTKGEIDGLVEHFTAKYARTKGVSGVLSFPAQREARIAALEKAVMAETHELLQASGAVRTSSQRGLVRSLWGRYLPGAFEDAERAGRLFRTNKLGTKDGFLGLPLHQKVPLALMMPAFMGAGMVDAIFLKGGEINMIAYTARQEQQIARTEAALERLEGTPELEQAVADYAAMTSIQRQHYMQQQFAAIQAAAQDPNMSATEAAALELRYLQLLYIDRAVPT